jgi:hypothetical protein
MANSCIRMEIVMEVAKKNPKNRVAILSCYTTPGHILEGMCLNIT